MPSADGARQRDRTLNEEHGWYKRLIKDAVRTAKPPRGGVARPRWACVKEIFVFGSTSAHSLCRTFGYDPDEMIEPEYCEGCHFDKESDEELEEDGDN